MGTLFLAQIMWMFAGLLLVASLLPLSKMPFGAIRGLAFPREQFFGIAVLLGIFGLIFLEGDALYLLLIEVVLIAVIQMVYIAKFTPIWKKQSASVEGALADNKNRHVSLLTANVKKSNREYEKLIAVTRDVDPDILMAIEVDDDWIKALEDKLSDQFEHWIRVPKDNGYGLCVMSRLPLSDIEVRELVTEEVPSVRVRVSLPCDEDFRLYVVHPEPPVIDHDTKGRDSEIALVGIEARDNELPAIVTGDLNDVAWSTTTRRFQRLSRLLDPRVGRGFYNTFSAFTVLMRWPLDHLFHDARFRLIEMKRLDKIASDHFPMLFKLALAENPKAESTPEKPVEGEEQETKKMIKEEKTRKREAIGSDWEDEE